jgi:glycosyltransferase involved in cell wall biosynthesis
VALTARTLAEEGYAVAICTLAGPPAHDRVLRWLAGAEASGVRIIRGSPGWRWPVQSIVQCGRWLRQGPDRILWTWGSRADVVGAFLARGRIARVSALRSASAELVRRRAPLWRWLDRSCIRYISNSQLNVRQLGEVIAGVETRCRVLYNGLEESDLAQALAALPVTRPPRLDVVMLGNLRIHAKGYDLAVEVARRARRQGLACRLRIAGGGHEEGQLRRLIATSGTTDMVELVGSVASPFEFLRQAHAFLLMSRYEGLPNAWLEAMAVGLPSVVTTVGDVGRLTVDGVHARHVEPGNVADAVAALAATHRDWFASLRMGAAARDLVHREFDGGAFRRRLRSSLAGLLPRATDQDAAAP